MAKQKNEWLDLIKIVVIAVAIALSVRTFLFSPIIVDGPSMLPTLEDRDQMIVNKIGYRMNQPKRFDIVVFHASAKKDFIKRVIGLPGEHIMVKDRQLYIDGVEVEESYLNDENRSYQSEFDLKDLPGSYETIPEGYVLVLGDNRNNSTDSRSFGLIAIDDIVGKASVIYWPPRRIQVIK